MQGKSTRRTSEHAAGESHRSIPTRLGSWSPMRRRSEYAVGVKGFPAEAQASSSACRHVDPDLPPGHLSKTSKKSRRTTLQGGFARLTHSACWFFKRLELAPCQS